MTGIYKITNPKGRVYIGQALNIQKRKSGYRNAVSSTQRRLYKSVSKYGFDAHTFEVLEECNEGMLNERERHWQEYYDVLSEKGMNCVLVRTDVKRPQLSEETLRRKSIMNKGKTIPQKQKDKISATLKGNIPWNVGMKGQYTHTDEHKENIRISSLKASTSAKEVLQFTKEEEFKKEYPSIRQALKAIGKKESSPAIGYCCKGKLKTAYGYIWKHKQIDQEVIQCQV